MEVENHMLRRNDNREASELRVSLERLAVNENALVTGISVVEGLLAQASQLRLSEVELTRFLRQLECAHRMVEDEITEIHQKLGDMTRNHQGSW
jgi:hypothetical protein